MVQEEPAKTLPEIFEAYARSVLAQHPHLNPRWEVISKGCGRRLTIPKKDPDGFDVVVEAETYGLYPFAGDWHGPAWEPRSLDEKCEELCVQFMGFVRSLLCEDSSLEVHYAGRMPYRWVLLYPTEAGRETEVMGLLLFNYFAKRSKKILQNRHLPPRYKKEATI